MQDVTFKELAKQRGLAKSTIRAYFHLKKHMMTEGIDWYTAIAPVKTNMLTPSGVAKIFPASAPMQEITAPLCRYAFRLSAC